MGYVIINLKNLNKNTEKYCTKFNLKKLKQII